MNKFTPTKILISFAVIAVLLLSSLTMASADSDNTTYKLLEPLPCVAGNSGCVVGTNTNTVNLRTYIPYVFNLLIAAAAVAAVVMIVWGGLQYMTTDSWQGKSSGIERAKNAVIGLIMVLCTYLILQTVNPKLVAIPDTIVKPLGNLPSEDPNNLFNQLQTDAAKWNLTTQDLSQSISNANSKIQSLTDQQNKILEQVAYNRDVVGMDYGTPQMQELNAQYQDLQNQIDAAKDSVFIDASKKGLNNALKTAAATNPDDGSAQNLADINNSLNQVKTVRDSATSILTKQGQYDLKAVNEQANYTEATLHMMQANAMLNTIKMQQPGGQYATVQYVMSKPDGSGTNTYSNLTSAKADIKEVIDLATAEIPNIADPKLKADLQARLDTLNKAYAKK